MPDTFSVLDEALYSDTEVCTVEPPAACTSTWLGVATTAEPLAWLCVVPGIWRAA